VGDSNKEWWADDRRDGYYRFYGANLWDSCFWGSVAFSEVEGRVLAGGLSSLRMEAAAIIVSLDNSLGREGFQKYPCRQFPAVELKEFWPDSYTRGYIYSVGDRFRSQDVLPYSQYSYTAVSRNNIPIS